MARAQKQNISADEKRRLERERKRKYRERIKYNPEKADKVRQYDRNRYKKSKESKNTKLVADMSERKKRKQRKIWKAASLKYRQNKRASRPTEIAAENLTPPDSPVQGQLNPMPDRRGSSNRKRLRKNRDREKRRIQRLEEELRKEKQSSQKWQRKYRRLKVGKNQKVSPSPRKVASLVLKSGNEAVKRQIIFGVTLAKQLKKNTMACKSQKEKQVMAKLVTGSEITRKKLGRKLDKERIISSYYQRNLMKGHNLVRKEYVSHVNKIKQRVVAFFESDENSCLAPGKRNFITRKKVEKNKRYLLDSIKNLFSKFSQMTEYNISYSSFVRLKPFWVINKTLDSRDTCLCVLHSNFGFKLSKLFILGIIKENSTSEFLKSICCETTNMLCMNRQCGTCINKLTNVLKEQPVDDYQTFYWKWVTKNETRTTKKREQIEVKVTVKEKIYCSAQDLIQHVEEDLPRFTTHCYKVWHQQQSFKNITNSMSTNEAAILMDWSENYVCKYNEEVQSVHFGASKNQISLHTGVAYINDTLTKKIPFCTVSNSMRHDAPAVWTHLVPIFSCLRDEHPLIDTVHFFSDGPTTQYKNKVNFFLLCKMSQDFGLKTASWNFSEPAHGKGPADGIGGVTKRTADKAVTFGADITDVKSFVESTKHLNVRMFIVHEHDITAMDENIPKNLKPIPKTMMLRQITWNKKDGFLVGLRVLSCVDCRNVQKCSHYPSNPDEWKIISNYKDVPCCGINDKKSDVLKPTQEDIDPKPGTSTDTNQKEKLCYNDVYTTSESETEDWVQEESVQTKNIDIGDFILIKLQGKKSFRHYVGNVLEKHEDGDFSVSFLRQKDGGKFVFPDIHEEKSVMAEEVIKVLSVPKVSRGRYIFEDDLNIYQNLC